MSDVDNTIKTFDDAEKALAKYIPAVKEITGKDITLDRMRPLMTALGNPQKDLKIIHIAGTSGKTSTAYYLAGLLSETGSKVGLTVSPYLDSISERVQIDLQLVSEQEFCDNLAEFLKIIEKVTPEPSYFELLMAFSYWYFKKIDVDYAVIETGLGGLHDASNVAEEPNKVCVITDMGFDHMNILGHTLPEITQQKAGIIHENNQVFIYQQTEEVMSVIQKQVNKKQAVLTILYEETERQKMSYLAGFAALPLYQQRNWLLSHGVFNFIAERDKLPKLKDEQLIRAMEIQVPGRMEIVTINGKTLIMDGAHNGQKMNAFVKSFQVKFPGSKASIVLALKRGKDYKDVLPLLQPICGKLIVTSFNAVQDLPICSIKPEELAKQAKLIGFEDVNIESAFSQAYEKLLKQSEDILIITGSLYLLSAIRPYIKGIIK